MILIDQAQQIDGAFFWGAEHLSTNLDIFTLLFALGLLLFSLLIYKISQIQFVTIPNWIIRATVSFCAASITWYFRLNNSWGDRTIFLEMLTHGHFFRMSQPLTTALYTLAYKGVQNWDWPPRNAIALVCSLAAFLATYILISLLNRLSNEEALITTLLLIPCSLTILFFGYVETTVLALTLHLCYFFYGWQYIHSPKALWKPAFALGLAIAFHGLSIYLLPSLLYLGLIKLKNNGSNKTRGKQLLLAFLMLILPTILIIGLAYTNQHLIRGSLIGDSLGGANLRPFVPLSNPLPPYERYTLISIAHFIDLLNVIFLISPIIILIIIFTFRYRKYVLETTWGTFLLISSLSGLLFAFLWNPDLGMQRDWDLFGPFLLPLLLLGGYVFAGKLNRPVLLGLSILVALNTAFFVQLFEPVNTWLPSIEMLPIPDMQYETDGLVWEDKFELLGFDINPEEHVLADQPITVTLYLRGLQPMPVGYTTFLHLTDDTGNLITQDDHQPYPPTEYWPAGEIQTSSYTLYVPEDIPPSANVHIKVGAYFWQTQERLTLSHNGDVIDANIIPLAQLSISYPDQEN